MSRACGNCALWKRIDGLRFNGGQRYGHCTAPAIGRLTSAHDSCRTFYVPAAGAGFDLNAATQAFERYQQGKLPGPGTPMRPKLVDTDALREKQQRHRRP